MNVEKIQVTKKPKKGTARQQKAKGQIVGAKKGTVTHIASKPDVSLNVALEKAVDRQSNSNWSEHQPFAWLNRIPTKIKADHPDFIPKYKSRGAACCDLVANLETHASSKPDHTGTYEITINPGMTVLIDCGFSMQLLAGYEAQIRSRSGMASRGIMVTNSPGTIDDDYRGRIQVILTNIGKEIIKIKHKERFAQMSLKPVWYFVWQETDNLDETERGVGGFGSTAGQ